MKNNYKKTRNIIVELDLYDDDVVIKAGIVGIVEDIAASEIDYDTKVFLIKKVLKLFKNMKFKDPQNIEEAILDTISFIQLK
ncbi:hypothetical protein M2T79_09305 [Elizabethkingia miricola]|uniref:hypothetical protein n=1 Tax=Elizabethkingia miricola TaxID=172045 RepID=UPI00201843B6|nr:hypothetical protein [Elizabethkingia miricola]MCL1656795.1 hypothetical protein [Elizabethkingia miricola]